MFDEQLSRSVYFDLYGDGLHDFDRTNHAGSEYQQAVLDPFLRFLPRTGRLRLADVASGKGEAAKYLEANIKQPVLRCDISHLGLSKAKGLRAVAAAEQLPIAAHSLDGVHCKDGLVHFPSTASFFREMDRVLKPGGILVVTSETRSQSFFSFTLPHETEESNIGFSSLSDLLNKMRALKSVGANVSVPYFRTNALRTQRFAAIKGFTFLRGFDWQPSEDQPDWHDEPIERFVLMFRRDLQADLNDKES